MRKSGWSLHIFGWITSRSRSPGSGRRDPWPSAYVARGEGDLIILRDLTYRVGAAGSAKLDVYMPAKRNAAAGRSALSSGILVIHGGSWIGGSKRNTALSSHASHNMDMWSSRPITS